MQLKNSHSCYSPIFEVIKPSPRSCRRTIEDAKELFWCAVASPFLMTLLYSRPVKFCACFVSEDAVDVAGISSPIHQSAASSLCCPHRDVHALWIADITNCRLLKTSRNRFCERKTVFLHWADTLFEGRLNSHQWPSFPMLLVAAPLGPCRKRSPQSSGKGQWEPWTPSLGTQPGCTNRRRISCWLSFARIAGVDCRGCESHWEINY